MNITKNALHDEPYLSQQEGDLKIEELDINQPTKVDDLSNEIENQQDSTEESKIYELISKMKVKQEESKELMTLELQKQLCVLDHIKRIHEVQQYLLNVDDEMKEKLQRDLSELEEAFKNVKYFFKVIDDNFKQASSFTQDNKSRPVNNRNNINLQSKSIKNEDYLIKLEPNILSDSSDSSQQFSNRAGNYKRGPYKRYTPEIKEEALVKIKAGFTVREVCNEMNIPKKNLRRWIEIGAERKKGGGRKRMDQEMEDKLHRWCIEESLKKGRPVSRLQIRQKALEFSKFPEKFKASKGWTDKFVKNDKVAININKKLNRQLQERGMYKQYHQRKLRQQQKQAQKIEESKEQNLENEQFHSEEQLQMYKHFVTKEEQEASVFESSDEEEEYDDDDDPNYTDNQKQFNEKFEKEGKKNCLK